MTLRHQVFLVLRFGWLVDRDRQTCTLVLDAELCATTFSRDFTILGSLAVLAQFSFRPMTLRRRVFPVLLFLGAISLARTRIAISIQQVF